MNRGCVALANHSVDDALELVGDHPGVRCHDQLEQPFHASCRQRLLVVFEHGLKRLGGAPLRMLRSERLDTVQGERELDVEWLLVPERPIVVEDGNPRRRRNEVGTLWIGHRLDERLNIPFHRTIVPRRQRIGLGCVGFNHESPSTRISRHERAASTVPNSTSNRRPVWT